MALRRRVAGLIRAATALLAMLLASTYFCLRAVAAHAREQLVEFGAEWTEWPELQLHTAARLLSINGLEVHVVTASTPLSVHAALLRFGVACAARGGVERPATLLDPSRPTPTSSTRGGTSSWESETEGVFACLDTDRPLAISEWSERALRFSRTGDLSSFGKLRYVLARRSSRTTTLLVFWTDGSLPITRAFPANGDAPGRDPFAVPRPDGARRLISAEERGAPYSVTAYAVPSTNPARLVDWYERELTKAGWKATRGRGVLLARRGSRLVAVRVTNESNAGTVASVLELS